jgi:hypothetical protein
MTALQQLSRSFAPVASRGIVATAWLLVACSMQAPAFTLPVARIPALPLAQAPVLYVSDFSSGRVNVYLQRGHNQQPIRRINGLTASLGLFVDRRRNLYVSQSQFNGRVLEFAPGGSLPMKTYDDAGHIPQGVARCPNGTLYVTNVDGNTISVYAHGSTKPTKTLVDNGVQVFSIACDGASDIFVTVGGKQFQVDEFAADGSGPTNLPIQLAFPEGIQIDEAGDIVVANGSGGAVEFYHVGDSTPFRSIAMPSGSLQLSFDHNDSSLWVSTGSDVERYSVRTGNLTDVLSINAGGLAASPAD